MGWLGRVAISEPCAKGNATTLDEQGPCEGYLRAQVRSRVQVWVLEPPRSMQHRVERVRLDTCIAHAFPSVWSGAGTIGELRVRLLNGVPGNLRGTRKAVTDSPAVAILVWMGQCERRLSWRCRSAGVRPVELLCMA